MKKLPDEELSIESDWNDLGPTEAPTPTPPLPNVKGPTVTLPVVKTSTPSLVKTTPAPPPIPRRLAPLPLPTVRPGARVVPPAKAASIAPPTVRATPIQLAPAAPPANAPIAAEPARRWFESPLAAPASSGHAATAVVEPARAERRPVAPWRSGAARPREARDEATGLPESACVFWLEDRRFALATRGVQEVVAIEEIAPVPRAPSAVVGLFNLRGTPVSVVDLAAILDLLGPRTDTPRPRAGKSLSALVLRVEGLLVAGLVREMDLIVPPGRGTYTPAERQGEHPAVKGFLDLDRGEASTRTITVLDDASLAARLNKLKFR